MTNTILGIRLTEMSKRKKSHMFMSNFVLERISMDNYLSM